MNLYGCDLQHPGGEEVLLEVAGTGSTVVFICNAAEGMQDWKGWGFHTSLWPHPFFYMELMGVALVCISEKSIHFEWKQCS